MTEPAPRVFIGGTKAWQTSMVPMRLFSVSTRMSSKSMSSALLGLGLPPLAPMSPPAQLTSTSTSPRSASILRFISATASRSPILPVTAVTRVPCCLIASTTSPRSRASPYLEGWFQSMSWMATSAPSSARRFAMVLPSPRPEPVTKAVSPSSSRLLILSSPLA